MTKLHDSYTYGRLALMALLVTTRGLPAQTLGDVLVEHNVPVRAVTEAEAKARITSFAVSATESPITIAYYQDDGSGTLPNELHILRYDRQIRRSRHTVLRGEQQTFSTWPKRIMRRPSSQCMGAVLDISDKNGVIALDTHISPSPGCLLVLDSQLNFKAGLWGWLLARVDGGLLFRESRVHFQAIEDAGLSVFDFAHKRVSVVYPVKDDKARRRFSAELGQHLPSPEWCSEQNNPCDPEHFGTFIEHVKTGNGGTRLSFDVLMSPEGFGQATVATIKPRSVHYIYNKVGSKWGALPQANN